MSADVDVPFVPTDEAVINVMLELANVGPHDLLYDLGSGDGRIVVAAARDRDARAVGIEVDPVRIVEATEYAEDSYVEPFVEFIEESIFHADFSDATVVTLYLLQSINVALRPRLLDELRPGTRIVSHAFDMGDWKPDDRLEVGGISIYKWIVPGKVGGVWEWEAPDGTPFRVDLEQRYQQVSGRAWRANQAADLKSATLQGNNLELCIQAEASTALHRFTLEFEKGQLQSIFDCS